MIAHGIVALLFFFAAGEAVFACPDTAVYKANASLLEKLRVVQKNPSLFDDSCFMGIVEEAGRDTSRATGQILLECINAREAVYPLSFSLFVRLAESRSVRADSSLFKAVVLLWEKKNGSMLQVYDRFVAAGQNRRADSLFNAVDCHGFLEAQHLMRWVQSREFSNDFSGAAQLYCRIASMDSRFLGIVLSQLNSSMEDVAPATVGNVFESFRSCYLAQKNSDTFFVAAWLALAYSRHGMVKEELHALTREKGSARRLVPRLIETGYLRLKQHDFDAARNAAFLAYTNAQNNAWKSNAAALMYKVLQKMGKLDSALVWLNRTGLTSESQKIDAISILQALGKLNDAALILDKTGPSLARDTLYIRQKVFATDLATAATIAEKFMKEWPGYPETKMLWRMRTLIFTGRNDTALALFDSMVIEPSWPESKELLLHRYHLLLFQQSPAALEAWNQVEQLLYTGKLDSARILLNNPGIPPKMRSALCLRILKTALSSGVPGNAMGLADECANESVAAELLYVKALVLIETGLFEEAKTVLLRLMENFPGDVFSEKARILLGTL